MPLLHEYTDRWGQTHPQAWSYIRRFEADFGGKSSRLEVEVFTSKVDAYAGRPPLETLTIDVPPNGTPAVMSSVELITPGSPAVYSDPDPETGEVVEVTPEVLPVYSEPEVIRPAVPSFGEVLAANAQAYGQLEASLAGLAVQVTPELASAVWEPVDPV